MLVEVCVSSIEDVFTVKKAKADRVELCSVMEVIGVTPSLGAFLYTKEHIDLPIVVMIRPRAGGFNYNNHEFETMLLDIKLFKEYGATSFVFGILDDNNDIDKERCQKMVEAIGAGHEIVFHKAFDYVPDKDAAMQTLIDLGFTRVLTSGGLGSTLDNLDELKHLIDKYQDQIQIMPGGGIDKNNVSKILETLNLDQIHLSAKELKHDLFDYVATDENHLREFVALVNE